MTLQLSVAARNARLDAIEVATGPSPQLRVYTGAPPVDCAAGNSGTLLATCLLPSDWLAAAAGGSKSLSGVWTDNADAAGNAGHYRIMDNAGTTCHQQGTVSATGGGGDMQIDNIVFAVGQVFSVTAFTISDPNG
jgi:hypothetical protein